VATATTVEATLRIVDDPVGRLGASDLSRWAGGGVGGVRAEWKNSGRALVSADGTGGAVLGLRTAFAAGWTARQGDRSVPCVRVAGTQLGAVIDDVSAGTVTFEYRWPRREASTAAGAGAALALALALGSAARRRTRFVLVSNGPR
jgi:hypothetical protein